MTSSYNYEPNQGFDAHSRRNFIHESDHNIDTQLRRMFDAFLAMDTWNKEAPWYVAWNHGLMSVASGIERVYPDAPLLRVCPQTRLSREIYAPGVDVGV